MRSIVLSWQFWALISAAFATLTAIWVTPVDKMSVVLVALFGAVLLGERLSLPIGSASASSLQEQRSSPIKGNDVHIIIRT